MFKKIKLGSSLAALAIFFLPWIDIQCSEKSMFTQSGFQVVYGGASLSEEMEAMGDNSKSKKSMDSDDSLGFAPLVALALLAVIGAVVFSSISMFRGDKKSDKLASMLPAVALLLLLIQMMVGFPAKKRIAESFSKDDSEAKTEESMGELMGAALMMNIRVKTTTAFYLELLALGVPTLLLANSLVDKYKKDGQVTATDS